MTFVTVDVVGARLGICDGGKIRKVDTSFKILNCVCVYVGGYLLDVLLRFDGTGCLIAPAGLILRYVQTDRATAACSHTCV